MILIIDDDYDIAFLIKTSLEKVCLSVSSFTDPLMALETFRQTPSSYDLVISDIRMLHLILNLKYPFIVKILFFLIMPKSTGPEKEVEAQVVIVEERPREKIKSYLLEQKNKSILYQNTHSVYIKNTCKLSRTISKS
jgi:response regulator RpfG family c-di-GMP phosphodiesterase